MRSITASVSIAPAVGHFPLTRPVERDVEIPPAVAAADRRAQCVEIVEDKRVPAFRVAVPKLDDLRVAQRGLQVGESRHASPFFARSLSQRERTFAVWIEDT